MAGIAHIGTLMNISEPVDAILSDKKGNQPFFSQPHETVNSYHWSFHSFICNAPCLFTKDVIENKISFSKSH